MPATLFICAHGTGATTALNTIEYTFPSGQCSDFIATEAQRQSIIRSPGVLSKFYVMISANNTNAGGKLRVRKNGADGNQVLSYGITTGGLADNTGKDYVAAGDKISIENDDGATTVGTITVSTIYQIFNAVTNTVTKCTAHISSMTGASTTYYLVNYGTVSVALTSEVNAKIRQRKTGTYKNMVVYVSAARATTSTVRSRKNGADGNLLVSLTGGATGLFEDTINSDTVVAGDDYNYSITTGTGAGTLTTQSISTEFISTNGDGVCVIADAAGVAFAGNTVEYMPIAGRLSNDITIEDDVWGTATLPFICSELITRVTQNSANNTSSVVFRTNSVNSALVILIGAGTTGLFADSTRIEVLSVSDRTNHRVVVTGGGAPLQITIAWISMNTKLSKMREFGGSFQVGTGRPIFGQ